MKKLILIPITVVTGFLAFAFLQPGAAGGMLHAVAPTLVAALPMAVSPANGPALNGSANDGGSGSASQGTGQGVRSGALSNPFDALVNPDTKSTTVHSLATAGQVNCGRFGGGFHGGKHLVVCSNPPYPPPANH